MELKHGGKRAGAGRTRSDSSKKMVSFRLAPDVIDYLNSADKPKAQVVEEALRDHREKHTIYAVFLPFPLCE